MGVRRSWLLLLVATLAGCTAPQASFDGHDRAVVWTAMVAVANAPSYDHLDPRRRWHVVENDVWPDAHAGTIEIHRMLERSLKLARLPEDHQRREGLLSVTLQQEMPETWSQKEELRLKRAHLASELQSSELQLLHVLTSATGNLLEEVSE